MSKNGRIGIAVFIFLVIACAILSGYLRGTRGRYHAPRESMFPPHTPIKVSFHRQPVRGGFLLMFDKPIIREACGDDPEVEVLGIGRVRADFPKLDETRPLEFVGIKSEERAVVIVKVKRKGWLFAPFERNYRDRVWDIGTDTASRLACRLALGSRSLQLPPNLDPRVVTRDSRVQPVVFDLPEKDANVLSEDLYPGGSIDLTAVDLEAKPDFGPATADQFRDKVLDVGDGVRMMLIDWVLRNPFQACGWRSVNYRPSSPMYKEHYLDLRFLGASSGDWGDELYALVQGADGRTVLLREYSRSWGCDTACGYVGVHTETDPASRYERVDNCRVGSPGYKAGIRNGDLILDVNGRPPNESLWEPCIGDPGLEVGDPVPVKVSRNGKVLVLTMTPIEPGYIGDEEPLRRGMYNRCWHKYSALLKGIPHTGGPATRVSAVGKARVGACLLSSLDPVPADFRPVKVSIVVSGQTASSPGHAPRTPPMVVRGLYLPEVPIPPAFWR